MSEKKIKELEDRIKKLEDGIKIIFKYIKFDTDRWTEFKDKVRKWI